MQEMKERLMGKTPEEIAEILELPLQKALIDFEMFSPVQEVIGADPMDLSGVDMVPVKSIVTKSSVLTIMAHPESAQDVANAFSWREDLVGWVTSYGEGYMEDGVLEFAFYALSEEQLERLEKIKVWHESQAHVDE